MKKYLTLLAIIFIFFGGCTTHRKVLKTQSATEIKNDIQHTQVDEISSVAIKAGKSSTKETSTVEEISIKKPKAIELTANFKIDSTATLKGDTVLKLVDVSDKNISLTIYQKGKSGELTAKIKSKYNIKDIPFAEINIKKTVSTKESQVDTTKIDEVLQSSKSELSDKSVIKQSSKTVEKNEKKVNYIALFGLLIITGLIIYFLNKK